MKRKPPDPRECGKSETGRSSDCSACYHSAELQIAQCSMVTKSGVCANHFRGKRKCSHHYEL